jgi:hypothetical protein
MNPIYKQIQSILDFMNCQGRMAFCSQNLESLHDKRKIQLHVQFMCMLHNNFDFMFTKSKKIQGRL